MVSGKSSRENHRCCCNYYAIYCVLAKVYATIYSMESMRGEQNSTTSRYESAWINFRSDDLVNQDQLELDLVGAGMDESAVEIARRHEAEKKWELEIRGDLEGLSNEQLKDVVFEVGGRISDLEKILELTNDEIQRRRITNGISRTALYAFEEESLF